MSAGVWVYSCGWLWVWVGGHMGTHPSMCGGGRGAYTRAPGSVGRGAAARAVAAGLRAPLRSNQPPAARHQSPHRPSVLSPFTLQVCGCGGGGDGHDCHVHPRPSPRTQRCAQGVGAGGEGLMAGAGAGACHLGQRRRPVGPRPAAAAAAAPHPPRRATAIHLPVPPCSGEGGCGRVDPPVHALRDPPRHDPGRVRLHRALP